MGATRLLPLQPRLLPPSQWEAGVPRQDLPDVREHGMRSMSGFNGFFAEPLCLAYDLAEDMERPHAYYIRQTLTSQPWDHGPKGTDGCHNPVVFTAWRLAGDRILVRPYYTADAHMRFDTILGTFNTHFEFNDWVRDLIVTADQKLLDES